MVRRGSNVHASKRIGLDPKNSLTGLIAVANDC